MFSINMNYRLIHSQLIIFIVILLSNIQMFIKVFVLVFY